MKYKVNEKILFKGIEVTILSKVVSKQSDEYNCVIYYGTNNWCSGYLMEKI
jgi:hypothetical protein